MPQLGIRRMILDETVSINLADGKMWGWLVKLNITYLGTTTCFGIK